METSQKDYGTYVLESILNDIKNMSDNEFEKYIEKSNIEQDFKPILDEFYKVACDDSFQHV